MQAFETYIKEASGREDVYAGVFDTSRTIDKVTIDFDKAGAIDDARKVYVYWSIQKKWPIVPVVSGRKGAHLHILSKPIRVQNPKEVLTDITYTILRGALGIKKWDDKNSVDHTIVGNPSALIRIPNTLRFEENNSYCSYLPPDWYLKSEYEILKYTKSPHDFNYNLEINRSLIELIQTPSDLLLSSENVNVVPAGTHSYYGDYKFIEKLLLYPVEDGRHRIVRFILCPYAANVLELDIEEGTNLIRRWVDSAKLLRPTNADNNLRYDYNYARSHGYSPWTLKMMQRKDPDLYQIIVNAVGE